MNYPVIYNLTKLTDAVKKEPHLSLSMTAAAAIVGTFPATITRARTSKRLVEVNKPFTKRPEVTASSVLAYFEDINRLAKIAKATASTKKKKVVAAKKKAPAKVAAKKAAAPKSKKAPAKNKPASALKEPAFGNGRGKKTSGNLLTKAVAKKK